MADRQQVRAGASETSDEFMEQRRRDGEQRQAREAAGRSRWAASTGTGENLSAARPSDVVELGTRYGALYAPPPENLAALRRQQAEFGGIRRELDKQNSWLAIPALAPEAVVAGVELAGAIAARFAATQVARAPLVLARRDPYLRVGDNWATRAGRRADKFYKDMADAKPGWKREPRVTGPDGKLLKPDLGTPPRTPDLAVRKYVEVKPNTPSGRAAAARQVKKYAGATRQKVRALFYDPKKFM